MLVFARKLYDEVWIGDDVVIKVVGISGDKVRLGIEAPAAVEVDRGEVRVRKLLQKARKLIAEYCRTACPIHGQTGGGECARCEE